MLVGVVGACGWAGSRHVNAFRQLGAEIGLLVDKHHDQSDIKGSFDASYTPDWRDLLTSKEQAVSVALPPELQPEVSLALAAAGRHVLCEKPVAGSISAIRDMIERSDDPRTAARIMPAYLLRFSRPIQRLRHLITTGELGVLKCLDIDSRVYKTEVTGWRLNSHSGGVGLVNGIHAFDLANWLAGSSLKVVSCTMGNHHFAIPVEDTFSAQMKSSDGAKTSVSAAWWPFKEQHQAVLEMDGWSLSIRAEGSHEVAILAANGLLRLRRDGSRTTEHFENKDLFVEQARTFLDCVRTGSPLPVRLDDDLCAQTLLANCRAAARGNAPPIEGVS
jgi:predicted dehydrogenase